ncbi:RHS repeat-associated core domain-containing protein [Ethanoligenens sp.]|uniref:RHS repeat-associated core domain-containing protein n=1 Tax=Ethanoligenens sp. TaxID=2099655 RepID=UPI0039E776D7
MNKVVTYAYDSWRKLLNVGGSLSSTVGQKNPYRYREYRYDNETGLYLLQSRYYDPNVGRFINADDTDQLDANKDHVLQQNLFAYCLNNPINHADPSGNWILDAIFLAVDVGTLISHPS